MHDFSRTVSKIALLYRGGQLTDSDDATLGAIGTAFFYAYSGGTFLITNWHNVTGIHPTKLEALHTKGLVPDTIRIHYMQWVDTQKTMLRSAATELPLYVNGNAVWLEHPMRRGVDIVAIPLDLALFEGFASLHINEVEQEPLLKPEAGMDCFVLGFPEGIITAANTPIWKRGAIAGEPHLDRPYYIDAATRSGMSGAPVIVRHDGIFGMRDGVLRSDTTFGTVERFVAIYSARVGDDALGFQLGTAWPISWLEALLKTPLPGASPLPPA